ncbi:myoD family inhibitor domain-containing protein 2 isoform X2 [Poecilia reticulata]|uniref:myoD family inhibitor domain-containing protein 2 isoform X2 n=1 Tax=Poecilia reticulata TaxID=8081 RepID=UPI0007EB74DC|nr:PREDICTED: myoD family inhibitor isoform X2 [Poecilia reticulata]
MEQMAAETTLKAAMKDKGVANMKEDNPAWAREVDCADIVLNCLFCRFHDMIPILPDCCQGLTNHCWPSYRHVDHTGESLHSDDDDSCVELDCGLFGNCHDASDCLELAMEVSEICYH